MVLHNSLDSVQAETRAFPNVFGGEKKVQSCGFVLADDSGVDAIFVNTSAFTGMYPTSYNGTGLPKIVFTQSDYAFEADFKLELGLTNCYFAKYG